MDKKITRLGFPKPYNHSTKECKKAFKHFGKGAEFRKGAYGVACENISIGKNVVVRTNSMLFGEGGITIEDDVLLGNAIHIYTTNHAHENKNKTIMEQGFEEHKPVTLKRSCWLGSCVVVLAGNTIGENAVVGAGSVVTKSVPGGEIWAGHPAKPIKLRVKVNERNGC